MFAWSQKLFLRINRQIGKNNAVDRFMIFCASYLIVLMYAGFVLGRLYTAIFGFAFRDNGKVLWELFGWTGAVLVVSLAISWLIALATPHHRPVTENRGIKLLIKPFSNWKSFPSDHTIFAFTLAWTGGMDAIVWFPLACLVAVGRVYVGVHYPRDIIGGFLLSLGIALATGYFFFL